MAETLGKPIECLAAVAYGPKQPLQLKKARSFADYGLFDVACVYEYCGFS